MFGFWVTVVAMSVFVAALVIGCYVNYDKDGNLRSDGSCDRRG